MHCNGLPYKKEGVNLIQNLFTGSALTPKYIKQLANFSVFFTLKIYALNNFILQFKLV
jgi:hypothetical protein